MANTSNNVQWIDIIFYVSLIIIIVYTAYLRGIYVGHKRKENEQLGLTRK